MIERTVARFGPHSFPAQRLRTPSFRAWSGAALSRYFHKSDRPEPQPNSSHQPRPSEPSSDEEMGKRREQLQKLLQQAEVEQVNRKKKPEDR
jgi:hypothetical protein